MTQNSSEYKWTCAPLLEGKIIGCLYGYLKKKINSTALNKQQLLYSKYFRLGVWISCLWIQSTQCFSPGQQQAIPFTSVAAGVDLRFWMALALAIVVRLQPLGLVSPSDNCLVECRVKRNTALVISCCILSSFLSNYFYVQPSVLQYIDQICGSLLFAPALHRRKVQIRRIR